MTESGNGNSIKNLLQMMMPKDGNVFIGRVTGSDPLEITDMGDEKLIISAGALSVPQHLTRHTVIVDISDGTVSGATDSAYVNYSSHAHAVVTLAQANATMVVHGELAVGELVYLLPYNAGKKYFVLGRVAE